MDRRLPTVILSAAGIAGTIGSGVTLGAISSPSESDQFQSTQATSTTATVTEGGSTTSTTESDTHQTPLSSSSETSESVDPLKDGIPQPNKTRSYNDFSTEAWGCTKKLFPGVEGQIDHGKTNYRGFDYIPWLNHKGNWATGLMSNQLTETQKEKTIGCGIAQMKPPVNNGNHTTDWYLKAEIVARNDRVGFILWVDWGTRKNLADNTITYRMMLIVNDKHSSNEESWSVKGGFWWQDNNNDYPFMVRKDIRYYIKLPGLNEEWYTWQKPGQAISEKTWYNLWVTNGTDTSKNKHIFADVYISSHHDDRSELLGGADITPFERCKSHRWCGWYYVGYYYEARQGWPKGWWGMWQYKNLSRELQQWYKPFKEVKGEWKKSSEACKNVTSSEAYEPLKKLCLTDDKSKSQTQTKK